MEAPKLVVVVLIKLFVLKALVKGLGTGGEAGSLPRVSRGWRFCLPRVAVALREELNLEQMSGCSEEPASTLHNACLAKQNQNQGLVVRVMHLLLVVPVVISSTTAMVAPAVVIVLLVLVVVVVLLTLAAMLVMLILTRLTPDQRG